ncbi:hypothetical protein TSMEX_002793 [Taenia solium]|eukprot:TsM_000597800 transcript=TsM_000597800 gene=TsM_000597800
MNIQLGTQQKHLFTNYRIPLGQKLTRPRRTSSTEDQYGGVLGMAVFLEGIGIIVLFSTQNLFINAITSVLSILLHDFEGLSGFSTVVWSLIMQKENGVRCCGMDSPSDFNVSYLPSGICPRECCAIALKEVCRCDSLELQWVFGCRSRITNFLRREMRSFTLISVAVSKMERESDSPID